MISVPQSSVQYIKIWACRKSKTSDWAELTNHTIRINPREVRKFIDAFNLFINPSDSQVTEDLLINISSGKAALDPVEKFLLNFKNNGEAKRQTLFSECKLNRI